MKRMLERVGVGLLALLCAGALALGFGTMPGDSRRVRAFDDAVHRWQSGPDYRVVSAEYVTLGVEAMRARPCGVSARHIIIAFRSLPGLPPHLAVGDTSAEHYDAFSRGELSGYLHLMSEQGIVDGIGLVEQLGRRDPLTDDDVIAFLRGFKLPVPAVTDRGAVAGVRRLLDDVGDAPFTVRADVATSLRAHVGTDPAAMTRVQQALALARLDANIRSANPELWRAKQVGDFLAGIWAQSYGQIYVNAIDGFFQARRVARAAGVIALLAVGWILMRSRVKRTIAAPSRDAPLQSLAAAKQG